MNGLKCYSHQQNCLDEYGQDDGTVDRYRMKIYVLSLLKALYIQFMGVRMDLS